MSGVGEAIGLAASVGGLVGLADQIVQVTTFLELILI